MAYFAELDKNNVVIRVIVVNDADCRDGEGKHSEKAGQEFCMDLFGAHTTWVQTFLESSERKNYAGPGYTFDLERDCFISPKPSEKATLNEETATWDIAVDDKDAQK